jgi:serine/threonine protein kinase
MEGNCSTKLLKKNTFLNKSQLLYSNRSSKLFCTLTKTTFVTGIKINFLFHYRDLKPENFLFESEKEDAKLKIIDFGLSTTYLELIKDKENEGKNKKIFTKLKTCAGTSLYMAPEVIKKQYSYLCDLWSAGVILYIMLAGYPPFYGESDMEVFQKITTYDYDFDGKCYLKLIEL